jgi:cysteine desulfurase
VKRVYLDNNATTPLDPEVFEAMKPYLMGDFGNASSVHYWGQRAKAAVETARGQVATLIHAHPAEVVFTSGGTESDNTAIFGGVAAAKPRTASGSKHLVTTAIEHHAVLHAARALATRGVEVTDVASGPDGVVEPAAIERALRPETVLISMMHANNELGTIQPLEEIGRIARAGGIPLHADAVQAVGKIPVDVEALGVDLLSLSAHKFYGPKGIGALYVRRGTPLQPLLYGGHLERDRRPGTENVAGIVGLGRAAEIAKTRLVEEGVELARLRDKLERGILARVPGVRVNGDARRRTPNTCNLAFENLEGESLVISLDLEGVACSTGAACSSGSVDPSHVLAAIGLTTQQARASIRLSLGRFTTEADVDHALEVLPAVAERLRAFSQRRAPVTA